MKIFLLIMLLAIPIGAQTTPKSDKKWNKQVAELQMLIKKKKNPERVRELIYILGIVPTAGPHEICKDKDICTLYNRLPANGCQCF